MTYKFPTGCVLVSKTLNPPFVLSHVLHYIYCLKKKTGPQVTDENVLHTTKASPWHAGYQPLLQRKIPIHKQQKQTLKPNI